MGGTGYGPGSPGRRRIAGSSTPAKAPKGKHVYLEIADVHDYAKVTLNGTEAGRMFVQNRIAGVTARPEEGDERSEDRVSATVRTRRARRAAFRLRVPAGCCLLVLAAWSCGWCCRLVLRLVAGSAGAAGGRARRRAGLGLAGTAGAAAAPTAGTPPAGYGAAGGGRGACCCAADIGPALVPSSWWVY